MTAPCRREPVQPTVRRVVIAEDDTDLAAFLRVALESSGYVVYVAGDGEAACELVLSVLPDLVFLDVMMPKLDGFDVLRVLKSRSQTRDIPVVLLTAKNSDQDVWRGWESGASYYLTKPFDIDELLRFVAHLQPVA